jgi:hypothetical protein
LAKLPYLLRWFDMLDDTKTSRIASMFKSIQGYRYDTIKPEHGGNPNGMESWMLNIHVAILLGEKDLQLSRYTAWERVSLTAEMKKAVWRTENDWFTLRELSLPPYLRKFFPSNGTPAYTIVDDNRALFFDLDIFFVKVSEFMFIVPNFPHLRGIEMDVQYKELWIPQPSEIAPTAKWESDPDRDPNQTFWPLPKRYLNGSLHHDGQRPQTRILSAPPRDDRVPRRGLVRVLPSDSEYEEICKQQGLHHLLPRKPLSPSLSKPGDLAQQSQQNGFTPPGSHTSSSINGNSPQLSYVADAQSLLQSLPNGIKDHSLTDITPLAHHK